MEEIFKVYKNTRRTVWEVSNYGNVKRNGELYKCRINQGYKEFSGGYRVHRAVAELFIPNPESKPEVDHIDTDPLNNYVGNLRWCTRKENCNNPLTRKHNSEALTNRQDMSKPVLQFTKSGEFVAEYPSLSEAQRQTGIPQSNISACCNGIRKSAGGFVWKWKSSEKS